MSARSADSLVPRGVRKELDAFAAFRGCFPNLVSFLDTNADDFRGLVVTESRTGGFLCILKNYGDDSGPQVIFCGGESPWACLYAAEKALNNPQWKPDTWKPGK